MRRPNSSVIRAASKAALSLAVLLADAESARTNPSGPQLILDPTLVPAVTAFEPLSDQVPRPVARLERHGGWRAHFVANELLLFTSDPAELSAVLRRWQGTLLPAVQVARGANPQQSPVHLIRVPLLAPNPVPPEASSGQGVTERAAASDTAAPSAHGPVRVSSAEGLSLISFALAEAAAGVPVGLNGIVVPPPSGPRVPIAGDGACPPGECPAPSSIFDELLVPVHGLLGLPFANVIPFDPFPPPPPPAPGESLRIGTFNTQCFQDGVPLLPPCLDARPSKMEELGRRIVASDYDVIALDEVWSEEGKWALTGMLSRRYAHFVESLTGTGERVNRDPTVTPILLSPLGVLLPRCASDLRDFDIDNWCSLPTLGCLRIPTCEDSGLMIFSRYPFQPLLGHAFAADPGKLRAVSSGRAWEEVAFTEYDECTNNSWDCLGNKGAALVTIQHPVTGRAFNIVFTHMQTGTSEANRAVRDRQFHQIQELVFSTLPPGSGAHNVLFMGDLNIHGDIAHTYRAMDPEPGRPEWEERFGPSGSFFLLDAWEFEMHDPAAVPPQRRDRGLTSDVDRPPSEERDRNRLDYIFRNHVIEPTTNMPLCTQQMTLARNLAVERPFGFGGLPGDPTADHLSDHIGVNMDLNLWAPYCSSATARRIAPEEFDPQTGTALLGDVISHEFRIRHAGAMQWFRIDEPGTYTIEVTGSVRMRADVYSSTDMSTPRIPYGGGEERSFKDPSGQSHTGILHHVRTAPFYIRVTPAVRGFTGSYVLAVHHHLCTGFEDECILLPNEPVPPEVRIPTDALDWDGRLYFLIDTDGPFDDAAQDLLFDVDGAGDPGGLFPGGFGYAVMLGTPDCRVHAPALGCLVTTGASTDPMMAHVRDAALNRSRLNLIVEPRPDHPPALAASWSTNLVLLHAWVGDGDDGVEETADPTAQDLRLKCNRQARRPDGLLDPFDPIDDEHVRLQIFLDGDPVGLPLFEVSPPGVTPPFDLRPDMGTFDEGDARSLTIRDLRCPVGFLRDLRVELEVSGSGDRTFLLRGDTVTMDRAVHRLLRREMAIREVGDHAPRRAGKYTLLYNLGHGTHELGRNSARPVIRPDGLVGHECTERLTGDTVPLAAR